MKFRGFSIANFIPHNTKVNAITYKHDIKLLDIHSTQMLGAYRFLSKVFGEVEKHKLSMDMLASSEVLVSLTLDKKQHRLSIDGLIHDLSPYTQVTLHKNWSILTLITDVNQSSEVLATVFWVFSKQGIQVEMMSQGTLKVNSVLLSGMNSWKMLFCVCTSAFLRTSEQVHCWALQQVTGDSTTFLAELSSS